MNNKYFKSAIFVLISSLILCSCSNVSADENISISVAGYDEHDDVPEIIEEDIGDSDDIDTLDASVSEDAETKTEYDELDELFSYDYKYKYYYDMIMNKCDGKNAVFSPEAFHSSLDLYNYFIDPMDKIVIFNNFTSGRNYSSFKSCDGFFMVNSIWLNDSKNVEIDENNALFDKFLHHYDASADLKKLCDDFIRDATNGGLFNTVPFVTDKDYIKTFSYPSFDSGWLTGDHKRGYDIDFKNADGSISHNVNTLCSFDISGDDSAEYFVSNNAHACRMKYSNGFTMTVILPDTGYGVSDINVLDFMNRYTSVSKMQTDSVYFSMPLFSIVGEYDLKISDFGFDDVKIDPSYTGNNDDVIDVKHFCDFSVNQHLSDINDKMDKNAISKDSYFMICNRPFLFYVEDTENHDMLYIGVVNKIS